MAKSLKLLSWNIQKFGEEKVADQSVLNFICRAIRETRADVVGLMELVGWHGNETVETLIQRLNNSEKIENTGNEWRGAASEMTPARPNEQYAFLWKSNVFHVSDMALWNVFGEEAFNSFFATKNYDAKQQEDFWRSLYENGWLDAAFQLKRTRRQQLMANDQSFDLTSKPPKVNLTSAEKTTIVKKLLEEEEVSFPVPGSRPPFLLFGASVDTKTDILLMLFHAPGPNTHLPISASNMLSLVKHLATSQVAVVMGDFNVDAIQSDKPASLLYPDQTGKLVYVVTKDKNKIPAYPFQRLTGPAFAQQGAFPDQTAVLNYEKRLADVKTSLKHELVDSNLIPDDASVKNVLSSEYDRFFVRAPKPDASAAHALNFVDVMVPKQIYVKDQFGKPALQTRSITNTPYDYKLTTSAVAAYNRWWDRQDEKQKTRKIKSDFMEQLLPAAPKIGWEPKSLREAQYAYLYAISDHLPIVMELQYA